MQIAQDRAQVMAANDMLSHTEPNGTKVYDRLSADAIHWYAAGEIIAYNMQPPSWRRERDDHRLDGVVGPPRDHALDQLQLRRLRRGRVRRAASATSTGVFVKQRDETGAWAKFGSVTRRSSTQDTCGSRSTGRVPTRAPGPDRRVALLPGPGQRDGETWHRGADDRDRHEPRPGSRPQLRGPGPGPGQGRQLGHLARPPHHLPDPAPRPEVGRG